MSAITTQGANDAAHSRPGTSRAGGLVIGLYAALVYLFFMAVLVYSAGFFLGLGVPKGIDDGSRTAWPAAVAIDLVLLNLFALQHTVMARPAFKRAWTRIVPTAAERSTFVLAASLVLALLCWQWRPLTGSVWQLHGLAAVPFVVCYVGGWILAVGSTYQIDHADLFGLRQGWLRLRGQPYEPPPFTERLLYRHIRHPLMAGFVIIFWSAPVMSVGHLMFAAASSAYIAVGITFEERDLIRSLGAAYLDYRKRVPAIIPFVRRGNLDRR